MDDNNVHNSPADESLDELIRESLRLESDPICVGRLERHWHSQLQRDAWRRLVWRALPLTAAAMLAAVYFLFPRQERPQDNSVAGKNHKPVTAHKSDLVAPPGPDSIDWQATSEPADAAENLSAGRSPTAYERILFVARTRIQESSKPPSATAMLEAAIDRIAKSPSADVRAICGAMNVPHNEAEKLLLEEVAESKVIRQRAILRLLEFYGTERSLPQLVDLASNETVRSESIDAMGAIVGVERLGEAIRLAKDQDVRYALMQRLLASETQPALLAYLELVRDEAVREEALAAGAELRRLPIEGFIALLDHEDETVRLASAVVLGKMNRCEMTEALIERIQHQPSDSKEAWFALFACRCDAADTFLAHATQSPQLLGQFNNARLQWSQLSF